MHRFLYFFAVTVLLSARPSSAAVVSFSGGGGGPIRFTIAAPISYTVTTANSGFFSFVFKGVGDLMNTFSADDGLVYPTNVVSTLTYSRSGGAAQPVNFVLSGAVVGSYAKDDLYFAKDPPASNPSLTPGDVVTLSAGTLATTDNFDALLPASGSFTTYLYTDAHFDDPSNSQISNAGVQVPEPTVLCVFGVMCGFTLARGRRGSRKI